MEGKTIIFCILLAIVSGDKVERIKNPSRSPRGLGLHYIRHPYSFDLTNQNPQIVLPPPTCPPPTLPPPTCPPPTCPPPTCPPPTCPPPTCPPPTCPPPTCPPPTPPPPACTPPTDSAVSSPSTVAPTLQNPPSPHYLYYQDPTAVNRQIATSIYPGRFVANPNFYSPFAANFISPVAASQRVNTLPLVSRYPIRTPSASRIIETSTFNNSPFAGLATTGSAGSQQSSILPSSCCPKPLPTPPVISCPPIPLPTPTCPNTTVANPGTAAATAGIMINSGNGIGANKIASCINYLTGPSCSDPCANQNSCMVSNSGNGDGGNELVAGVNLIEGGNMICNGGNGRGGNRVIAKVNVIGGNGGSLVRNSPATLIQSLMNLIVKENCTIVDDNYDTDDPSDPDDYSSDYCCNTGPTPPVNPPNPTQPTNAYCNTPAIRPAPFICPTTSQTNYPPCIIMNSQPACCNLRPIY